MNYLRLEGKNLAVPFGLLVVLRHRKWFIVSYEPPLPSAVLLKSLNYSSTTVFIGSQPRTQVRSASSDSHVFLLVLSVHLWHGNKTTSHTFALKKQSQDMGEELRVRVGAHTSNSWTLVLALPSNGPKTQVTSHSSNNENKQFRASQLWILTFFKKTQK